MPKRRNVRNNLKESLKEMKLMREGKLPKHNLDDFLNELGKNKREE